MTTKTRKQVEGIRNNNRWPKMIPAFAIGLGAGAVLGLLFAPKSGEELREDIVDGLSTGWDETVGAAQTLVRRAQKTAGDATDQLKDAAAQIGERVRHQAAGATNS